MKFVPTTLEGAFIVEPEVFGDERGFFLESYSRKEFAKAGIDVDFLQDNHSMSAKRGVLRGLHFQKPPHTQEKLVRVVRGAVLDVIVDLRRKSPTFGKWESFKLSAKNFRMLFVPKGFAHGFCTLEDNTEFLYKASDFYAPKSEGGIAWNDADLGIDWPLKDLIINERDKNFPLLKELDNPF